jgi:hypothetical protein
MRCKLAAKVLVDAVKEAPLLRGADRPNDAIP